MDILSPRSAEELQAWEKSKLGNDQLINQDSGNFEWYTPPKIMDLVRELLGGIELDPASNDIANKLVKADRIFTKEDNGLERDWKAETLWLNHPFSKGEKACKKYKSEARKGQYCCKKDACKNRGYHIDHDLPGNNDWIKKLVGEFNKGNFKRGCNITFANTSENWFRPLYEFPQVFLYDRVNFVDINGNIVKGVTKGCVITCFGMNTQEIDKVFGKYGKVK
ncbi:DNA N-6-adenine-methyltransferase [Vibrio phage PVP-XSN]|uniref:DNA N-6-adenine-methyltransferase n=1 Tax=Vibrio phage PVP-XSN TaxID=3056214 RepID=A0AAX3Y4B8_9CAUD|nr:DNA N-6-adenine-methyltransferase [Vibrio phage PVP-XSN]